jgi:hypothetical protein
MRLNSKMPNRLITFYKKELQKARDAFGKKDYRISWRHLERAHILGQPPVGNTGGADVPPLQPMEKPKDLLDIINKRNIK